MSEQKYQRLFNPACIDEYGFTPNEFRVFAHLSRRANRKGLSCYPSIRSIAEKCRMGASNVQLILRDFVENKILDKKPGGGKKNPNHYRINPHYKWAKTFVRLPKPKYGKKWKVPATGTLDDHDSYLPQVQNVPSTGTFNVPAKGTEGSIPSEGEPKRNTKEKTTPETTKNAVGEPPAEISAERRADIKIPSSDSHSPKAVEEPAKFPGLSEELQARMRKLQQEFDNYQPQPAANEEPKITQQELRDANA